MKLQIDEPFRTSLYELLYLLDRATRLYRQRVERTSPATDMQELAVWCDLADRTLVQARNILDAESSTRGMRYELKPPEPYIAKMLSEQIIARRALRTPPRPRPPGPGSSGMRPH